MLGRQDDTLRRTLPKSNRKSTWLRLSPWPGYLPFTLPNWLPAGKRETHLQPLTVLKTDLSTSKFSPAGFFFYHRCTRPSQTRRLPSDPCSPHLNIFWRVILHWFLGNTGTSYYCGLKHSIHLNVCPAAEAHVRLSSSSFKTVGNSRGLQLYLY